MPAVSLTLALIVDSQRNSRSLEARVWHAPDTWPRESRPIWFSQTQTGSVLVKYFEICNICERRCSW
jgi:hypothetical protein